MKEYTKHQQGYIDSVDGAAHITAVVLIGSLDERIAELEADIVTRRLDYTEDCKRLDARIEELELRIADESRACALFQSHIRELEQQLAAEQDKALPAWFRIQGLCSMTAVADEIIDLERQLAAEKKRRMHYQHIVYNVCNMLDQIDGRHSGNVIVCGTAEEPCSDVETRIQQLTAERDSLRQQLAAEREANRWIPVSERLPAVSGNT